MFKRYGACLFAIFLAAGVPVSGAQAQSVSADGPTLGAQGVSDKEAAAIKTLIEAWTSDLQSGDMSGWERYWTSDPVLAAPGHDRFLGRSQIAEFARKSFGGKGTFSLDDWSIAGQEDLAVVTNTLTWSADSGDGQSFNQMIVLRKDGSNWRIQSVIYNTPG